MALTTATAIAAYLGRTLSTAEEAEAAIAAASISSWIEARTGRSWGSASPVVGEQHDVRSGVIFLRNRPAVAVTEIKTRALSVGSEFTVLAATEYELVNSQRGLVLLTGYGEFMAEVSYTHGATVPADLARAATILGAGLLPASMRSDGGLYKSVKVNALTFTYRDAFHPASDLGWALSVVNSHRTVTFA